MGRTTSLLGRPFGLPLLSPSQASAVVVSTLNGPARHTPKNDWLLLAASAPACVKSSCAPACALPLKSA